jgi:predicted HTH transcriptional regulator
MFSDGDDDEWWWMMMMMMMDDDDDDDNDDDEWMMMEKQLVLITQCSILLGFLFFASNLEMVLQSKDFQTICCPHVYIPMEKKSFNQNIKTNLLSMWLMVNQHSGYLSFKCNGTRLTFGTYTTRPGRMFFAPWFYFTTDVFNYCKLSPK